MIKRTIEISRQPAYLSTKHEQLVIESADKSQQSPASIPIEDIGVLVVDQPQVTYTHGLLSRLLDYGATLVICGQDHLPAGLLLPLSDHSQQVHRLHDQINASSPLKKQLWKQVVIAKIHAQADNLPAASPPVRQLMELAKTVKSGDATNCEAQAARIYWANWRYGFAAASDADFRRNSDGDDIVNSMLNYGYAIVRAAIARALVAGGLHPALGIHHHHRANAFCLADDLIEPLRPMVDRTVSQTYQPDIDTLDQTVKAQLLSVLTQPVEVGGQIGPMMVGLHRMVGALAACLRGQSKTLLLPRPVWKDGDAGGGAGAGGGEGK